MLAEFAVNKVVHHKAADIPARPNIVEVLANRTSLRPASRHTPFYGRDAIARHDAGPANPCPSSRPMGGLRP